MMPMAQRSAEDLAGLMVLSAQTWNELPSKTIPDFEEELARSHLLSLRSPPCATCEPRNIHGLYIYFLEEALAARLGTPVTLKITVEKGGPWLWTTVPVGDQKIDVGFPYQRIGTRPFRALLVSLLIGFALAGGVAIWLARSIAKSLARLDRAAASLGLGDTPELLPEDGPRELANLAHRFNEMAFQVRDLLAARTTLLAGISHDLRTPLARMRLALEMLSSKPTPALVRRMEADIEEMSRLIGDLLNLARGLEREPLREIELRSFLGQLKGDLGAAQAGISIEAPDLYFLAPPLALHRILVNLLENALRYGNGRAVTLVAMTARDWLRIGVLDRGPGIPDDQMEAVFQPFHRIETSRNAATGGSGLGLAIVRQLAKANGWRVTLHPRQGGGLEAWLALPLRRRE
ncbi:MAG: HAMP domain-containing protein [Gammaproteobacteria bacterium]|nr:HAMP domain-containing protein [Gammaproteobacteria bacterium]MBU1654274.1 HAMP domain-containing protein [Gammaproteobacteria bacterium]MBU1960643.1 HAMP domain-containing protein [Gammaproteobacteria bacterium]